MLFIQKRYEEALAAYAQALQLDPNTGLYHTTWDTRSRRLVGLTEAEQAFRKARGLGLE